MTEPRFILGVTLIDREETNDDGEPYVYESASRLTENELRQTEYIAPQESAAWQLAERLVPKLKERKVDELGGR